MSAEMKWSLVLKEKKQLMLDDWLAKVRVRVPAAKYQEKYSLLNSMPLVVDSLETLLAKECYADTKRSMEHDLACIHGLARSQQQDYSIADISQEYLVIRDVILETLERECGKLPSKVFDLIHNSINLASHSAQQTFIRASAQPQKALAEPWHLDESRYRMIVEEVEEYAIFMIDTAGHVASWNKGTFKIKGYKAEEIIGLPFRALFVEEDAAIGRPEWELEYALQHGRYSGEGWRQRQDGSKFWASVVLTALRNEQGEVMGWCKITRDLTTEKKAEEELRKAEEATRAKSVFLANMSHEIRTPLGAMMGFADLLQDDSLPDQERSEFAETIKRNGEQLVALIDGILDLSKVEAGKLEIKKDVVYLADFLNDIHKTLFHKARAKGLGLDLDFLSGCPRSIVTDAMRLRQILLNIIGNAIKFTDAGTIRIEVDIRLAADDKTHDMIRFIVSDTGVGISPEYQKRLFQPFTQAHSTTQRLFAGTGLGLALSREIARALGGDLILVESEPGEGSTFLVAVDAGPREREMWVEDPKSEMKPLLRTELGTEEAQKLTGISILLVDDSVDNQKLISTFLMGANAKVEIASNGQLAVEAAKKGQHDIILMDIQMPGLNGYEATQQLRESGYERPIVALTAFAMKEERDRSEAMGFDEYLTKPVNKSALLKTINSLLYKRRQMIKEVAGTPTHNSSGDE